MKRTYDPMLIELISVTESDVIRTSNGILNIDPENGELPVVGSKNS